jgi:hypothetical protein
LVVVTTTLLAGAALAISDFTLAEIWESVGAASLPAVLDGAVAAIGELAAAVAGAVSAGCCIVASAVDVPAAGATALAGAVAEIVGCPGAAVAAAVAVSADDTLGVNAIAGGDALALVASEPPALTGGELSMTGALRSTAGGFAP